MNERDHSHPGAREWAMWSRKRSTLDVSYLNLRLCIGVLGVALAFILRIGSAIFPPDPYSVSGYYYSTMRNILVASLCVLGIFLLTYRGYDKLDSRITNVCGAATIGVALFPPRTPDSSRPGLAMCTRLWPGSHWPGRR